MKEKFLKHKKRLCGLAAALLAICMMLPLLIACTSGNDPIENDPPESMSDIAFPPEDGSSPESYSGAENIAYLAGKLSQRDYYHTESVGTVQATALLVVNAGQTIYGSKDYKDGVLLTNSVSISNNVFAPSKAIQRFYGDGKVVVRGAASDVSAWTSSDVEWSTGAPLEILDKEQSEERYGVWASELSDYVITKNTVLESSSLTQESGRYVLTVKLDPDASTYYYRKQMVTMGNLDEQPSFSSVQLTFTFGEDWTVYSIGIEEEYSSKKIISASCKGSSVITFSYDEGDVDVSAYESYFKQYASAPVTDPEKEEELTAADYLGYGLAPFLTEEVALHADVTVGGASVSSQILLDIRDLTFRSLKGQIGSLTFACDGEKVYLSYKNMQGYIAISDALSLFGGASLPAAETGFTIDTDALLEDLFNAEIAKDGDQVTLSCTLDLGALQIPVRFGFNGQGKEVTFAYADAQLTVGGTEMTVHAEPASEKPAISVPEKAVDLYPYIASAVNLVNGGKYEFTVDYADAALGLSVNGDLLVDAADGVAASGNLEIVLAGQSIPVSFTCVDGTVYLRLFNIGVKASAEEIGAIVNELLSQANVTLPEIPQVSVGEIVASIVSIPFDMIIKDVTLTEDRFAAVVNVDALLSALTGSQIALGDIEAAYTLAEGKFTVAAMGAEIAFSGSENSVSVPDGDYIELSYLVGFFNAESFGFSFRYGQDGAPLCITAEGRIQPAADAEGAAMPSLQARVLIAEGESSHYVEAVLTGGALWASYSTSAFGAETALKITLPASSLAEAVQGLLPVLDLLGIDLSGIDWNGILAGILQGALPALNELELTAGTDESGNQTLTASCGAIAATLTAEKESEPIAAPENAADYMDLSFLPQLAGDLTNTVSHIGTGFDISAKLYASMGGQSIVDTDVSVKIALDESGELRAQITLNISGWALLFAGEAKTEIVIQGGNIYIVREQTSVYDAVTGLPTPLEQPVVERRAMTMAHFANTVEEQIYFALNVSDTLKSLIDAMSGMLTGTPGDVGEWFTVGKIVRTDAETGENAELSFEEGYAVTLDIGKILGGTLLSGQVTLNIFRDDANGLTSIEAEGALSAMGFLNLDLLGTKITVNDPGAPVDMSAAGQTVASLAQAFGYADEAAFAAAVAQSGYLTLPQAE